MPSGHRAPSPEVTSQVLSLPILILGMVSTGFAPGREVPPWIRGFAQNQPISVWADTMRHLDGASEAPNRIGASLGWVGFLAVLSITLILLAARKNRQTMSTPTMSIGQPAVPTPLADPAAAVLAQSGFRPSPRGWAVETMVLTGRQLLVWVRDPLGLMTVLGMPVPTMIMFKVVLGEVVGSSTGQNSAFGTVPLVILLSAMFGSLAAAIRLNTEAQHRPVGPVGDTADQPRRRPELTGGHRTHPHPRDHRNPAGCRPRHRIPLHPGHRTRTGHRRCRARLRRAFAVAVLALAVFFRTGAPVVPLMSLLTSLLMFFNPVSPRPTAIPAGCSPSCAINR